MSTESEASRRRAGEMVEEARKKRFPRLSKRAVARAADISEVWYRAITTGLPGEGVRTASSEVWVEIARAVGIDPAALFDTLGRELPNLAGADPQPASDEDDVPVIRGERMIGGVLTPIEFSAVNEELRALTPQEQSDMLDDLAEATDRELRKIQRRREAGASNEN